ncbi:MAG: hypothetical protein GY928_02160 [Colwellia sp.]|nr:hypothetical protein [Colwellia sp.]
MIVLIYDDSPDPYNKDVKIKEFKSESELIKFVNEETWNDILGCYNFTRKIEIEPFKKVTEWRLKDKL